MQVMQEKHVDEFIEEGLRSGDHRVAYAAGILNIFRLAAVYLPKGVNEGMYKLFVDYKGERYRITGASRMGDVWLRRDHALTHGYDEGGRVSIAECSNFSPTA